MSDTVITKVGVVVRLKSASEPARFLVVQPHGKHDAAAPYVLPRGTRQYRHPQTGEFHDARDEKTALLYADFLEDTLVTATRELEEEAGVPRSLFHARNPQELGLRNYHSPSGKGVYPIMWYGVNFIAGDETKLLAAKDSAEVLWMSLKDYETHANKGSARRGYIEIIQKADAALA